MHNLNSIFTKLFYEVFFFFFFSKKLFVSERKKFDLEVGSMLGLNCGCVKPYLIMCYSNLECVIFNQ
jgi:hypothetical protein